MDPTIVLRVVITTLAWVIALGTTWSLYLRGFIFYPFLVLAVAMMDEAAASLLGLKIFPMVPGTVVGIMAFLAEPCAMTTAGVIFFCLFWGAAYRHLWWLMKLGFRKDKAELVAAIRKFLYHKFDYLGACLTKLPPLVPPGPPETGFASIIRTWPASGEWLVAQPPVKIEAGPPAVGEVTVTLDPSVQFQTCMGFGGAFTESSAELLEKMSSANQELIVDAYYKAGTGNGYQLGRVHMNSCDFSRGNWTCCSKAGDKELTSFSIERYQKAIIPMIQRATKAAGRSLTLLGSPWSPPAWMKDSGQMLKGGKLLKEWAEVWAKHYVLFAKALKEAGFPLWGFTVQNEPNANNGWENCMYSPEEERDFIRDHLGPALEGSGLDLKLLAWDHNRDDLFQRALVIEKDPGAAKYVHGYGWHWYGDPRYDWWAESTDCSCFENVRHVHDLCPKKHLWITEVCQELGSHIGDCRVAERYAETLIKDFSNGCEAFMDWNLILDQDGGPNHDGNCCSAPVLVDVDKDRVLFQPSFFYIGHFSRYIQPGARRILAAASRASLEVLAFANPDGTIAVVVLNESENFTQFCVSCNGTAVRYYSAPHTIHTVLARASDFRHHEASSEGDK